ncbi:MAG TPA: hypothetical protein VEO36_13865 [Casimicrobiaceae bacterium]|nr:hypothetical protein [Casimicrobiaceae bacterium]
MPARNDDVVDIAAAAVIVDRSIDGSDDTSVVIVILVVCAVNAIVAVERKPTDAAIVELSHAFIADAVRDSRNRGKEG